MALDPSAVPAKRGVGAIETGMALLEVLAAADGPIALKDIALAAGMPPAKAHRYLASFAATGMVTQEHRSGRYDLGPAALRIGVAALGRHDPVKRACERLTDLRDTIRATCFVAGWSDRGPLVLRWEDSLRPVTVIVSVGSVLPLLTSATGRAFLGFLPQSQTSDLLSAPEHRAGLSKTVLRDRVAALRAEAVQTGFGRATGDLQVGIDALSAPIHSAFDTMVGAVTALGPAEDFDASPRGATANALQDFARSLSSGKRVA
ncbi:MAG: IclR family transcriptional regulator [Pseudomonadota bacterium]